MKNRELQRLFMLDHNANCIPEISEYYGEHPFVWDFFSVCVLCAFKKQVSGSDPPVQIVLSLGSS